MNDGLPKGYQERTAKVEDMQVVVELWNACSREEIGLDRYQLGDAERIWSSPGFNLETDTRLVIGSQGELCGYCEVWDIDQPHVSVQYWGCTHPQHQGAGIGTYMMKWAEQRVRQAVEKAPAEARVSMMCYSLSSNKKAADLFVENGFELVRYSWRMVIDLDRLPPEPQWPVGIQPRHFVPGQDERATFAAGREAFSDHWGHTERPFEEAFQQWLHRRNSEEDFDPSLITLAMDGDEIAGVCHCQNQARDDPQTAWVGQLSVRRPWRRRGLGLALLHNAFGEFYRRGRNRVSLGVDAQNLTGAVRLYEKAGMCSDPKWEYSMYEKELRPGVELRKV
jgi:mycothiol synthase